MSADEPICAITGASGTVGSSLKKHFLSRGWSVRELHRTAEENSDPRVTFFPFTLGEPPPADAFNNAKILIHCAYDFKAHSWADIRRTNGDGSIQLIRAAKERGVAKIIFISSVSAYEGCASLYGRGKLLVEKEAGAWGVTVVRPGLVYGPSLKGIFGNLARIIKKSRILPLIGSGRQPMNLIHEEDLARCVFELAGQPNDPPSQIWTIAHPDTVPFKSILETLARIQNRRVVFFPVPFFFVLALLKCVEALGARPRLRSDGLIGLMNPNPNIDFRPLQRLSTKVRKFSDRDFEASV